MVRGVKIETPLARILAARTGHWLVAHTEAWHEKSRKARIDPGWFHPSGLGQLCDAKLAFDYLGVKPRRTLSARTLRIFDNGTSRDGDWKRYLHRSKLSLIKTEEDRRITIPELHLRGEVDDYVENPLTHERYVFEFKTMNSFQWKRLYRPLREHIIQVHPYMRGLGVTQAFVLYENKDTQDLKPFIVHWDATLWTEITYRLSRIVQSLREGVIPQRTPPSNDSSCGYFYCCAGYELTRDEVVNVDRD